LRWAVQSQRPSPHEKQLAILPVSGYLTGWGDFETKCTGATAKCCDIALPLLLFITLLPLVDESFAAREHEVHHAGELVGHCGIGARLVHARAQAPVERAQRRIVARQAHGGELERLPHPIC
jgi:hypothetical protein